jgi:hypothetical protein
MSRNEGGADADGRSASTQGSRDALRSGDATRCHDRYGDAFADLVQQRIAGLRPTYVPTGLDALGDEEVAAGILRRERVIEGAYLPGDKCLASRPRTCYERGVGRGPEHLDDAESRCRGLESPKVVLDRMPEETHADRAAAGTGHRVGHPLLSRLQVEFAQHSERTGARHRAGELRAGDPAHWRLLQRLRASNETRERGLHMHPPVEAAKTTS